jgi:hypothetical protein
MEPGVPRHGTAKTGFVLVNGGFGKNPMANPPIRASRLGGREVVRVIQVFPTVGKKCPTVGHESSIHLNSKASV